MADPFDALVQGQLGSSRPSLGFAPTSMHAGGIKSEGLPPTPSLPATPTNQLHYQQHQQQPQVRPSNASIPGHGMHLHGGQPEVHIGLSSIVPADSNRSKLENSGPSGWRQQQQQQSHATTLGASLGALAGIKAVDANGVPTALCGQYGQQPHHQHQHHRQHPQAFGSTLASHGAPVALGPQPATVFQPMAASITAASVALPPENEAMYGPGVSAVGGVSVVRKSETRVPISAAEWSPPPRELPMYERMFSEASAGSTIPGTVSGRAAVQFFSMSGVPKETLKTIWSLCDPSHSGSIRRPAFFAAMRLIALAQTSSPPSLAVLEATRFATLEPPRMRAQQLQQTPLSIPEAAPTHPNAAAFGSFLSPAAPPLMAPSLPSHPVPAPENSILTGLALSTPTGLAGVASPVPSSEVLGVGGVGIFTPSSPLGRVAEEAAAAGDFFPSDPIDPARRAVSSGRDEAPAPGAEAIGAGTGDEDDFGDFAEAAPALATSISTGPSQPHQQPQLPIQSANYGGEEDDFGEFAGAEVVGETPASASPSAGPDDHAIGMDPALGEGGKRDSPDLAMAWREGLGGGPAGPAKGAEGGGLDDFIQTNLNAATATESVRLASMERPAPDLLGKPQDPVMVTRADDVHDKLSVFDAMADLDLAVGQEDWNDFADETTAPSRPPTPPRPPVASAGQSPDDKAVAGAAPRVPADFAPPTEPASLRDSSAVVDTARTAESPAPEAHHNPASSVVQSDDDGDRWGDFEDAPDPQVEDTDEVPVAVTVDSACVETPEQDAARTLSDDSDHEWGAFVDVPPPTDAGGVQTETDVSSSGATADERPAAAAAESPNETSPPGVSEPEDPFAAITPPSSPARASASPPGALAFAHTAGIAEGEKARPDALKSTRIMDVAESLCTQEDEPSKPQHTAAAGGMPLSLRALRDELAARGHLEEAMEVQKRMEAPPVAGERSGLLGGAAPHGAQVDAAEGEEEDGDLERWRTLAELTPAPTLEELAQSMSASDAGRADKFREAFVDGRPAVEEQALSKGGAVALGEATRRQRAAKRALYVSEVLEASSALANTSGNSATEDPALDFGMQSGGGRSPPNLSDWASMVAFVTRMTEKGVAAISNAPDSYGDEGHAHVPARGESTSPRTPEDEWGAFEGSSAENGGDTSSPSRKASDATLEGDVGAITSTEVARSAEFSAFARGLGQAVIVCRMLQAAAEDGLEHVEGFEVLERAWADFRRRARRARQRRLNDGVGQAAAHSCQEDDEDWPPDTSDSRAGGSGRATGTVAAIREAAVTAALKRPDLCAVTLQPLEVFADPASPAMNVVTYCGVRFLACAINLWVNAQDRAPPGPLRPAIVDDMPSARSGDTAREVHGR